MSIDGYDGHGSISGRGPQWIGVLVLGIMLTFSGIIGAVMFSAVLETDDAFSSGAFDSFDTAVRAMTIGMLILGLGLIALSFYVKKHEGDKAEQERLAEKERSETYRQDAAERNAVKVRCRYCGALNGEHDEKCKSCGAPL